jgi:hypothetical protein
MSVFSIQYVHTVGMYAECVQITRPPICFLLSPRVMAGVHGKTLGACELGNEACAGVRSAPYPLNMYICRALFTRLRIIRKRKKRGAVNGGVVFFGLVKRQKCGSSEYSIRMWT